MNEAKSSEIEYFLFVEVKLALVQFTPSDPFLF
jgi:hypothetical protein